MEQRFGIVQDRSREYMRDLMEKALTSLGEVLILDEAGRMVYISEEYARNMRVDIQACLGKYIGDVIEDSILPTVLKSGKATMGATYYRDGKAFLVNRVPIKEDGKVVGVVAQAILSSDLEANSAAQKIAAFMRELNFYKGKYQSMSVSRFSLDSIVSRSRSMEDLKETLQNVAGTRSTVLLTGESGTGKEVFAGALHSLSPRRNKPFARINCAAIPDNLLESELFGYEEGAFTGAVKGGKIGDFEAANGGTIFLDEVNSLSPNMQAKLLRVIQDREIKKVGSTKSIPIDVRFIFATNKDLYDMVQEGSFREDFYYRINVVNLRLPPLRERQGDVPLLVESFIRKFNRELDMDIQGVEPAAMPVLESYHWPGNIRQLENCVERAFNYCSGRLLRLGDFGLPGVAAEEAPGFQGDHPATLKEVRALAERIAIQRALEQCGGNKSEAAERLAIDRSILYDKIKRYGL